MKKSILKIKKKLSSLGIKLRRERIVSGKHWSTQFGFFEKDNEKYLIVNPEVSASEIESLINER